MAIIYDLQCFKKSFKKHNNNKTEKQCPMRLPNLKIIITGTQFGYKRDDGVLVIPIGCLKD